MASSNEPTSAQLYFAFGSNMHLEQMAKRCPRSTLHSKGRLHGYKWQINYRGVANIVEGDPKDFVEGLLFVVTHRDVATLDRNEGVSKGFYKKVDLTIESEPLSVELPRKAKANITATARWLKKYNLEKSQCRLSLPPELTTSTRQTEEESGKSHSSGLVRVQALVYVSDETREGQIRREYVVRMRSAMLDAQELGVSKTYLDTCLDPLVSARDEEIASTERAAVEHGESLSDRHLAPAGRIGGIRNEENRQRERRRKVDDTAREYSDGEEESRELRGYHNDRLINPREAQMRTRGRDIDFRDDRDSTRASNYGRDEVGSSWVVFKWVPGDCGIL